MKRILVALLLIVAAFQLQAQKNQPINIITYNVRYSTEKDGVNAWSKRKDNVKALVKFHEADILCAQEALAEQFAPQSDFKFLTDTRDMLVERAGELNFADDLLKRWLLAANEKNTKEKIDEDFPQILQDLKYQLIKENLVKKNGLKVEDADIENFAKRVAKAQFAQYGMLSVPEDVLDNYAKDMLKNKQTLQNIIDRAVEEKLAAWLKEQVELDVKEVTADEFNKLFE